MANGALIEGVWTYVRFLSSRFIECCGHFFYFSVRGGMLSVLHYGSGVI